MISVIDMPPPEESAWWRGKRGFEVGFFPCEYVEVINNGSGGATGGGAGSTSAAANVDIRSRSSTVPKGVSLATASTARGEEYFHFLGSIIMTLFY